MRAPQLWPTDDPFSRLTDLFDPASATAWRGGTVADKYGIVRIHLPDRVGNFGIDKTFALEGHSGAWDHLKARDRTEYDRLKATLDQAEASHRRIAGSPIAWILLPPLRTQALDEGSTLENRADSERERP